jgi:hypothetical protein
LPWKGDCEVTGSALAGPPSLVGLDGKAFTFGLSKMGSFMRISYANALPP